MVHGLNSKCDDGGPSTQRCEVDLGLLGGGGVGGRQYPGREVPQEGEAAVAVVGQEQREAVLWQGERHGPNCEHAKQSMLLHGHNYTYTTVPTHPSTNIPTHALASTPLPHTYTRTHARAHTIQDAKHSGYIRLGKCKCKKCSAFIEMEKKAYQNRKEEAQKNGLSLTIATGQAWNR